MDFELPGAEDLDALERDALEWPEESLDGHDVCTWRASRMSGWVADTLALRDSPLMGFYDDPTVDADDDEPPTPDADERILRAMASCPNLRDSVRGCPRRAREAWRSEKAIRSKLAADEAIRRHDRDALRHQSDPCAPPVLPPSVLPTPAHSRPVSRVMSRAASQEWRHALYGPMLEENGIPIDGLLSSTSDTLAQLQIRIASDSEADPRSITPTPALVAPQLRAEDAPRPSSLASVFAVPASPSSPARRRPPPIMVPDRSSTATTVTGFRDSVLGAFPAPPSTPLSPTVSSRTRSGSGASALPTPALTWSSPSLSESRFDDSDDETEAQHTLAPPVLPFIQRKARWSLGYSSRISLSSSALCASDVGVLPQEPKAPKEKSARSGPNLLERTARRLSVVSKASDTKVAFPVQRSPSSKSRRTPSGGSHRVLRHSPSTSSFLTEDPFASTPASPVKARSSLSPPPLSPPPKRKSAVSFSNFSLRGAFDVFARKPSKSPLAASPAPASVSVPAAAAPPPMVEHVLLVSGLPISATMENSAIKTIASWLGKNVAHMTPTKVRRRSNGILHVFFVAPSAVDINTIVLPDCVHLPNFGNVAVCWMPDAQPVSPPAAPFRMSRAPAVAVPGVALAL